MSRINRRLIGVIFLTLVAAAGVTPRAEAFVEGPGTARLGAPAPGYLLDRIWWVGRTSVDVYYNWDGGTCVLDGDDFSGPASAMGTAVAQAAFDASIQEINTRLRGGLVLVAAGPTTRAKLCSKDESTPIVVGFGRLSNTGHTLSSGRDSAIRPGWIDLRTSRVFVSSVYDFACADAPTYRDVQLTITHELLHALGVGHSQDATALMAGAGTSCQRPNVLQPDDVAALVALYPPPAAPTPGVGVAGAFDRTLASSGVTAAVWNGGTNTQLTAAAAASGGVSVTLFVSGAAVVLIPGAPAFVNAPFTAAFPSGVPAGTIVLVVK